MEAQSACSAMVKHLFHRISIRHLLDDGLVLAGRVPQEYQGVSQHTEYHPLIRSPQREISSIESLLQATSAVIMHKLDLAYHLLTLCTFWRHRDCSRAAEARMQVSLASSHGLPVFAELLFTPDFGSFMLHFAQFR